MINQRRRRHRQKCDINKERLWPAWGLFPPTKKISWEFDSRMPGHQGQLFLSSRLSHPDRSFPVIFVLSKWYLITQKWLAGLVLIGSPPQFILSILSATTDLCLHMHAESICKQSWLADPPGLTWLQNGIYVLARIVVISIRSLNYGRLVLKECWCRTIHSTKVIFNLLLPPHTLWYKSL